MTDVIPNGQNEHDQETRIERILGEALKQPTSEARERCLAMACGEDTALLAELRSLLAAHTAAGDFLEQSVMGDPRESLGEGLGTIIGHYKLLEQIGEGGFGVVYMAEQVEPIRRKVALKIVKAGMDTRLVIARFEAERQALALMDHPNIARVLDAGTTDTGRPYFIMELVQGIPITEFCDRSRLFTAERLGLFIKVCQAVQHAHQKGIIHRDLKPSNVLVTLHDGEPVPKVIDFGVAKALGQRLTDKTLFTGFLRMVGTPAYMSPEQAELGGLDIDTRSDIYSLGVLLYELLTGVTPFDAEALRQVALDEVRRMIRETEPPRPSTRLRALGDKLTEVADRRHMDAPRLIHLVSGDLDWIAMKCLEKDRRRRYDTANLLAMDVQRHLENEPIVARPPSAGYRLLKLVRRNKLVFAAGGAVATALMLGLGISTTALFHEKAARERAVTAGAVARIERMRAEAAASETKRALALSHFLQAVRLIAEDDVSDAAAHLRRSLEVNSTNTAAAARLVTLLTYHSWMLPSIEVHHGGFVSSAQFGPEGQRVVTTTMDGTAQVWDAKTGQPLAAPMKHGAPVWWAEFSPDGKQVLTASSDATAQLWDAQTGLPVLPPFLHSNAVTSAHFSPDGKQIVTIAKTAQVWDAQTGQPRTPPLTHSGRALRVGRAIFSPDGRRIVTASGDNTARVWDAQDGQPLTGPMTHDDHVYSAQFSPDGTTIVTASGDCTARVWDAQTGQPLTEPMQHESKVIWAQFSQDGTRVLTAATDATARIWDARTGRSLIPPLKHHSAIDGAEFSPDGTRVGTRSQDGAVHVWDAQTGRLVTQPLQHSDFVSMAQFSPDGKRILTACRDASARIWQAQTHAPLSEPLRHRHAVVFAAFSPNGRWIATISTDNSAYVWDAWTHRRVTGPLEHGDEVRSAQFSPDSTRLLTASFDKTACLWDVQTGQRLTEPFTHSDRVWFAQFSPDGTQIVTASSDHTAQVWDAQTGRPNTEALQHSARVNMARFSPDGSRIVTASHDNTARVWDARTGRPLTDPLSHGTYVFSADFSPDSQRIVTTCNGGKVRVWDAQTGRPLTRPIQLSANVSSAQFGPEGRRILTARGDSSARVLDAQTGRLLIPLLTHSQWVSSADFSPDGNRIITASSDATVQVWDSETGQPLMAPLKHGDSVSSARFSPDGNRVVTAAYDNSARVWDIAPSGTDFPPWLLTLTEAFCCQVMNEQQVLEPTRQNPVEVIRRIRLELDQDPDASDWVVWGRWLLAEPSTRTISPFSKITLPQYIENRIQENTSESLAEAERLAAGNQELLEQIESLREQQ